jgi:hypothetical protein
MDYIYYFCFGIDLVVNVYNLFKFLGLPMDSVNYVYVAVLLLALSNYTLTFSYRPDLPRGPYCSLPLGDRPNRCCFDRMDSCYVSINETRCYCDEFCLRTRSDDCCPDFWDVCKFPPNSTVTSSTTTNNPTNTSPEMFEVTTLLGTTSPDDYFPDTTPSDTTPITITLKTIINSTSVPTTDTTKVSDDYPLTSMSPTHIPPSENDESKWIKYFVMYIINL